MYLPKYIILPTIEDKYKGNIFYITWKEKEKRGGIREGEERRKEEGVERYEIER
jgi:hypothetical protein